MSDESAPADYLLAWHSWRSRRLEELASLVTFAGVATVFVAIGESSQSGVIAGSLTALTSWLLSIVGPVRRTDDMLRLTADGLTILGTKMEKRAVKSGYRIGANGGVIIDEDGRELRFELRPRDTKDPSSAARESEDVDRIFDHLDKGLRHRALHVGMGRSPSSVLVAFMAWLVLQPATCLGGMAIAPHPASTTETWAVSMGILVIPFALARWIGKRAGEREMVIGSEGVSIGGVLVRYGTMTGIAAYPDPPRDPVGVRLRRITGTEIRIALKGSSPDQVAGVVQRIRAGFAAVAGESGRSTESEAIQLQRGARSVAEWRERLRRPAEFMGGFRDATMPAEDAIARVLANGALPVEPRVAAALVLRDASASDRARVRIAAEATVDPDLRRALRIVLADEIDDAALGEALDRGRREKRDR